MNTLVDQQKEIRNYYIGMTLSYLIGILLLSVVIPLIMLDIHKPIMGVGFWVITCVYIIGLSLVSTAASFSFRRITNASYSVSHIVTANNSIDNEATTGFDPWSEQQTYLSLAK